MNLNFLNFKSTLCILSSKEMRANILDLQLENRLEFSIKFADSYLEAAKLIEQEKSNPFDHVILNLSFSNRKLQDFVEHLQEISDGKEHYIIEYTNDGELFPVELLGSKSE